MKKSDEIKNGLNQCRGLCGVSCPYHNDADDYECQTLLAGDAIALIEQLEETICLMKIQMHGDCGVCKHRTGFDIEGAIMSQKCYECLRKESRPNWEYEGLPEVGNKCR